MIRHAGRLATCCLATALAVGASTAAEAVRPSGAATRLPKDVSAYVERRTGCNHWTGEDAYDAARGREIAKAVKDLGCKRLDADEKRLRARYGASPAILKALDQAKDAEG